MARQGLQGRSPKRRRRGLTRPDKAAAVVPDLLRRDFTAERADQKWVGDFKQVDTDEGPVFLATVEDLYSRRMLGYATSDAVAHTLNTRPRKTLNWRTPAEALDELLHCAQQDTVATTP